MTPEVTAIGVVVVATALVSLLAKMLKQPIIPAYILAGLLIGPIGLKMITDPKAIQSLSDLTIIFVMFTIGLELDLSRIRTVGKVVTLGGVLQVVLTAILGFGLVIYWFNWLTSIYLGLLFAFGSTTLVVKLLADKRQLDTLHGGIALGILLLQDILAILALSLLSSRGLSSQMMLGMAVKSFGIVAIGVTSGQYVFPWLLRKVSDSTELLTLMSIAIGFGFAFLAENQGLSASIGAFITGVSLANLPYRLELQGRVKALRDFFMPVFFAALGVQIVIPEAKMLVPIVVLTLACLTLKPLLISVLVACFGYQRRTAFFAGISLVPVSEFGLVLVAVGIKLGQIESSIMTLSIVVMALSMLLSAYLFGDKVYPLLSERLRFLDRIGPVPKIEHELPKDGEDYDVVLIGCHRAGRYIYDRLCCKHKFLVLEYSFERVKTLNEMGIACRYGDAVDPEVWEALGDMPQVKMVISTIPDLQQSAMILSYLRDKYPDVKVILSAEHIDEAQMLMKLGADYVICSYVIAGKAISDGDLDGVFDPDMVAACQSDMLAHIESVMGRWKVPPLCREDSAHIPRQPVGKT